MATLKRRSSDGGYYIPDSFSNAGRLFHVTYQVTGEGIGVLASKGIRADDRVPKPLLQELIKKGSVYTNSSGVKGQALDSEKVREEEDGLLRLSAESQGWVVKCLIDHPLVETRKVEQEIGFTLEFNNVPENFIDQLVAVALRVDGTNFLKNLDLSYNNPRSQGNRSFRRHRS